MRRAIPPRGAWQGGVAPYSGGTLAWEEAKFTRNFDRPEKVQPRQAESAAEGMAQETPVPCKPQ